MKDKIYGIIMGVMIAVCAFCVYFTYNLNKQVNEHQTAIVQIVDFINKSMVSQKSGDTVTK